MTTLAIIVGITSGFILDGFHRAPATMIATSLAIDASLAPLTALVAARRGRPPWRWAIIGFMLGTWAFAFVLLSGERHPKETRLDFPPTSDAA